MKVKAILPALFLAPFLAWADAPADYAFTAPISVTAATPFHRIELPAAVYRVLTYSDQRDLRVFNAAGEVVPHAIEPRPATNVQKAGLIEVPLFPLPETASGNSALSVQVEKRSDGTIVSVLRDSQVETAAAPADYLLDTTAIDGAIGALELVPDDPGAQFSGRVRVEVSDDLDAWRTLTGNAPLLVTQAGGQRLARLRIEWLPSRSRYLRMSWADTAAGSVRFSRASVEPAASTIEGTRTWERVAPLREQTEDGDYVYELPPSAPIDRLRLHLPQVNSVVPVTLMTRLRRDDAWHAISSHIVYRLQENGVEFESPDIAASPSRQLLVRMDKRGGGLGSGGPALEVGWTAQTLVFAARGAMPYRLAFGDINAKAATYPIESLVPDYRSDSSLRLIGPAQLGAPEIAGGEARLKPQADVRRWLLWSVLLASVLILAAMAYRLWKQMGHKDTLAGSDKSEEHEDRR